MSLGEGGGFGEGVGRGGRVGGVGRLLWRLEGSGLGRGVGCGVGGGGDFEDNLVVGLRGGGRGGVMREDVGD